MLHRFSDCNPQPNRPTWGTIKLSLTTDTGVHTVTGSLNGVTRFTGSRTGDGTIDLYDTDGALVGTVDLTYSFDFENGLFVEAFPAKYNIYYSLDSNWSYAVSAASWATGHATLTIGAHNIQVGERIKVTGITPSGYNTSSVLVTAISGTTVSYSSANPGVYSAGGTVTRPAKAILYDDGKSGRFSFYSSSLAAGTYYVLVRQVNEDGTESSNTTLTAQTIVGTPTAPSLPAYYDGEYADTRISWTALTGTFAAATYNGYDSLDLGVISPDVAFTHIAGVGTLLQQLAAIDPLFTGTRYVVLRSLFNGVESANSVALQIVYESGAVVLNRPNPPQLVRIDSTSGKTLSVVASIDTNASLETATSLELFASLDPEAFDYTSPIGTTVIAASTTRILFKTVSGSVVTNGPYYFAIRTNSPNGQSTNTNIYGPVQLSDAVPPNASFTVTGSI